MTVQLIVSPERIETELLKIWEKLSQENKMRASLFNLIVFNRLSSRVQYVQSIVQKIVEKFPCRTLFISEDPDSKQNYLKTAVSVVTPSSLESTIACDQIDIGVAGLSIEKVPSLILPHLLPDLPTYVLWTEDPNIPHPLLEPLIQLATRVIFDSESTESIFKFAQTLLKIHQTSKVDIADLNWARTQGWRDLISSTFDTEERIKILHEISSLELTYNARVPPFFCHQNIQSVYLLAWLASRLDWQFKKTSKSLFFRFESNQQTIESAIESTLWEKLGSGTVTAINIQTQSGSSFHAFRIPERYHYVKIHLSSAHSCEVPYEFLLGKTATGQSLVQEIYTQGTSRHYLDMLQKLLTFDENKLC